MARCFSTVVEGEVNGGRYGFGGVCVKVLKMAVMVGGVGYGYGGDGWLGRLRL